MNNQIGLAGLQQHGVAIPGETRNIEYFFNLAKKMSDGQLADILSGKSLDVPQFVAMTEAMGRKQLRTAMQGQQAQQQARQPSVKEQLLASEEQAAHPQAQMPQAPQQMAGLDHIPAQNIEHMAGGGIIAFDRGGDVPGFAGPEGSFVEGYSNSQIKEMYPNLDISDPEMQRQIRQDIKWKNLNKNYGATSDWFGGIGVPKYERPVTSEDVKSGLSDLWQSTKDFFTNKKANQRAEALKLAPSYAEQQREIQALKGKTQQGDAEAAAVAAAEAENAKINPPAPTTKKDGAGLPAIDVAKPTTYERRASPFGEMKAENVDVAGIKNVGLGEGLMRMASHIISTAGPAGLGAAFKELADSGAATRKEIRDAEKDARDFNFLVNKAKEAHEQGQDELAFHYSQLAETKRHNPVMEKAALMTAQAHQTAAATRGNIGQISLKDATKEFNDLTPAQKRALPIGVKTPTDYFNYLNGKFTGFASAPGEGATIRQ